MNIEKLFSMTAEEIRDNFQEAVSCIRENRRSKGGLPSVWHEGSEMEWDMTAIVKRSAQPGFEVGTNGEIIRTGFDRTFCA
jgi:hypothetical protein